jgi:hypothetical protein
MRHVQFARRVQKVDHPLKIKKIQSVVFENHAKHSFDHGVHCLLSLVSYFFMNDAG